MEAPLNTDDMQNEKSIARKRKFWLIAGGVVLLAAIAITAALGVWLRNRGPREAGIGVPINRGGWEVTITDVHVESELSSGFQGAFTLKQAGTTFFVVDYSIGYKEGESKFALYATATSENGEILAPEVMGFGMGNSIMYGTVERGKAFSLEPGMAQESPFTGSLAFIIPTVNAQQAYRIQFLDLPNVTFLVEAKP